MGDISALTYYYFIIITYYNKACNLISRPTFKGVMKIDYPAKRKRCDARASDSWLRFYRATLCIRGTSHGSVSVCPSVCPSQAGVLLKRQNVGSHKQHHTIPQGL